MPFSYREYVKQLVTHYAKSPLAPAILSWQLVNEAEAEDPRGVCNESAAARALRSFADDVGHMIKQIDPRNMVNIGSMGGQQCGWQTGGLTADDYRYVNASPYEDWCEFHDYGGDTATALAGHLLIDLKDCNLRLRKPLFVGEFGLDNAGRGKFCGVAHRLSDLQRSIDFNLCFRVQYAAGVVGITPWSFHDDGSRNCGLQPPPTYEIGPCNHDPTIGVVRTYAT
jgi:hypothetical protein